jgi:hypothetical protein
MPVNRATAYAVPGVMPKARMIDNIHAAADARTEMVLIALPCSTRTIHTRRCWIGPPPMPKPVLTPGLIADPGRLQRRPPSSRSAHGGDRSFAGTATKRAAESRGPGRDHDEHCAGRADKALAELSHRTNGGSAKGALNRETAAKVEQVEELNARSRKYNLPAASASER